MGTNTVPEQDMILSAQLTQPHDVNAVGFGMQNLNVTSQTAAANFTMLESHGEACNIIYTTATVFHILASYFFEI